MHNISVKLDDSQFAQVEAMAKQSHKSRAAILREAIDTKVGYEEYKRKAINDGLIALGNGDVLSHDEVMAKMLEMKKRFSQ